MWHGGILALLLFQTSTPLFATGLPDESLGPCKHALRVNPDPASHLEGYGAYAVRSITATADIRQFRPMQGVSVTDRDQHGNAKAGTIRVLVDHPGPQEIYVLSEHNGWGARLSEDDRLRPIPGTPYYGGRISRLSHGMEYRLLVNGRQLLDPAANALTASGFLNSIFWDFDRPGALSMRHPVPDLREKPKSITEAEIYHLVRHWGSGPRDHSETYRYVAESGIIDELRRIGINAIELLPFNASVEGESWHLRYQIYSLFAPNPAYGTPDEFGMMIDAFNAQGIAVIMDSVVSHYPFHGNQREREISSIGLHQWRKADGTSLYGDSLSPWNTYRYDYQNPLVRRFLVDSILHMIQRYRIGGIRFDNIDGIRFEPGGWEFLRELSTEIQAYRPELTLIGEMFFGDRRVVRALHDEGGLGIHFRSHSDFFDFIKDHIQGRTESVDMERLRAALNNIWDWGEAMRVTYVTNHDEAANRRDGATGAYLPTLLQGGDWKYVEGKTRAFAALAMLSGAVYMDMPQLRLLQEGSFGGNASIEWHLLANASQRRMYDFFSELSRYYIGNAAFAPHNLHPRIENHIDHQNKVISLDRFDRSDGKKIYILINLGHQELRNYRFGVDTIGRLRIAVDSDYPRFGGTGNLSTLSQGFITVDETGEHGKPHAVNVPYLAPYGVVIMETEQ